MSQDDGRLKFGDVVDRVFWSFILAIAAYVANQAGAINKNISELNEKVAVVLEKVANQEKRNDTQDIRILHLEEKAQKSRE